VGVGLQKNYSTGILKNLACSKRFDTLVFQSFVPQSIQMEILISTNDLIFLNIEIFY
jgi:hypothetical protein